MCDTLYENMDNGQLSGVVFLDIRKAFDSIDHTILLQKMNDQFGIKNVELDWFKSYLTKNPILMIYQNASKKLRHTYTLMILKFLLLPKLLRNLLKI